MSEFNPAELKYYALIFGVILLILIAYRQAVKKVQRNRDAGYKEKPGFKAAAPVLVEKPKMSEEQFKRSWRSLSYLLLLAGIGNLYMAYTALNKVLAMPSVWVYWVDVLCSVAAAIFAVLTYKLKTKTWIFAYFIVTMIPMFLFMSIKGQEFKINAMIHLFPLVLLYFVLKPVWNNLETS
jgi:TRAP-type C4-dicarboxylate transport system permease small subunit